MLGFEKVHNRESAVKIVECGYFLVVFGLDREEVEV
jgi:hypothetical protein